MRFQSGNKYITYENTDFMIHTPIFGSEVEFLQHSKVKKTPKQQEHQILNTSDLSD